MTDIKTYIPKKRLWVSTVEHDIVCETMAFKGNKDGIRDYSGEFAERHVHGSDLKAHHERIVKELSE